MSKPLPKPALGYGWLLALLSLALLPARGYGQSHVLQQWAMTANNNATVTGAGVVASAPTLTGLNTLMVSPSAAGYSATLGQALAPNAGSGGGWTGGAALNRSVYQEFTVVASGSYRLRVDSLVFSATAYNTANGRVGVSYSAPTATPGTTAFTPLEPTGAILPPGGDLDNNAPVTQTGTAAFTASTTATIARRNAGPVVNANTYRVALNGATGVTVPAGSTLRIRLYLAVNSTSSPRPVFLLGVAAKGQAIAIGGVAATTAQVSFSTPAAGGYSYTISTTPAGGTATLSTAPSSSNGYVATYTLSGLTPGTAYTATVAGTNGTVSTSISADFTTNAGTCADPSNLAVGSIGQTTAQVSFAQPTSGNTNTGYTLRYYPTGTSTPVLTQNLGAAATGTSLTGLSDGTDYTVTLQSVCPVGTGTTLSTSFTTLTCADPTAVTVSNVSGTTARLNFTPGAANSSFAVSYYPTATPGAAVNLAPTAAPVALSGLTPGTAYTITLQSTCANGAVGSLITRSFSTGPANSLLLAQWPLTTGNADNAAVRSFATVPGTPTLTGLALSTNTTASSPPVPAYSSTYGQAFSPNASGDGGGWTSNVTNSNFFQEFSLTAASGNSLRADSLVFSTAFVGTNNGKLALAYSLDGFSTAGTFVLGTALNAPVSLTTTFTTYRLALGGLNRSAGQTVTFRFYYNAGSNSAGRYGLLRNVYVAGEGFVDGLPNLTVTSPQSLTGNTTYGNVTVLPGATLTLSSPLQAQGAVVVQEGGVLNTNCQPITGNSSFQLLAGAELQICDPAGITASGAVGAVQTTGTRSFSPDALYTYTGTTTGGLNPGTGSGLPAAVRSLTVRLAAATDTLQLGSNVTVGNVNVSSGLTLSRGLLKTYSPTLSSNYLITMVRNALITESTSSYVLGQLRSATLSFVADGNSTSFGNIGLTLTAYTAGGAALPGNTYVVRTTGLPVYGTGNSTSIRRQFRVVPVVDTNLNLDLTFRYLTSELNGIPAANLHLFSRAIGATYWVPEGGTISGNTVSKTGLTHLSDWTLGNAANPLPVELTQFVARRSGQLGLLSWTTAQEKNNQGYEVQVAPAATAEFRRLGFVAGAGTSTSQRQYQFVDAEAGKQGLRYYRLKQLDLDGTVSYSTIVAVRFDGDAAPAVQAANPFRGDELTLFTQASAASRPLVRLTDALGRPVREQVLAVPAGAAQLRLTGLGALPAGVYTLHLTIDGQACRLKLLRP